MSATATKAMCYNIVTMKLFAISDLHGIHPSLVIDALGRQGFMLSDPNHVIAVAGDIVDGHGHDDALVS